MARPTRMAFDEGTRATPMALLALEDGTCFWGVNVGAPGETFGELVFNTGMTGYQEVLTDPSYRGQIVVMTYPEIGIYGVNREDIESGAIQVAGFVVHRAIWTPFNRRATCSFPDYLRDAGVVALEGVDTRALTRRIRSQGAMRGAISTVDQHAERLISRVVNSPSIVGRDLVREASPKRITVASSGDGAGLRLVVVDSGAKEGILRELSHTFARAAVTRVPYDESVESILALEPDGVLVTNGPGDPAALEHTVRTVRGLLERRVPTAGICLGHQLLGLAAGGTTYKMCFGHRGCNHPVKDLNSGRVSITTQNHGFAIDPTSLGIPWRPLDEAFQASRPELLEPGVLTAVGSATMAELVPEQPLVGESPLGFGAIEVTQMSLNDGTVEGLRFRERPAFSVQYHPEASPGPHDAKSFFSAFAAMVEAHRA